LSTPKIGFRVHQECMVSRVLVYHGAIITITPWPLRDPVILPDRDRRRGKTLAGRGHRSRADAELELLWPAAIDQRHPRSGVRIPPFAHVSVNGYLVTGRLHLGDGLAVAG
jgi:hypothetical protein